MKKIGIIIFGAAIIVGILISNFFSFGKMTGKLFNFSFNSSIAGSGNMSTQVRSVEDFTKVEVGGVFQVEILAQQGFSVQVEADDNLLDHIKTEVDGDVLKIHTDHSLKTQGPIRVRITVPNIERVDASGASKILVTQLKNAELEVDLSGACKMTVTGETSRLKAHLSGASNFDGSGFTATDAEVNASGASHASVNVPGSLEIDASGASRVNYSGSPKSLVKHSSGASSIGQK